MKNPSNPKERSLVMGAIRRVFSRSELRRKALELSIVEYRDEGRKRVTKWSRCPECLGYIPTYLMQVDHVLPIIHLEETLEGLNWDLVIDRVWCEISNLRAICKTCHSIKTKAENKERRMFKKKRTENG